MKLTLTFDDVGEKQARDLMGGFLKDRLYFSERLKLVKAGEYNLKKRLEPLFHNVYDARGTLFDAKLYVEDMSYRKDMDRLTNALNALEDALIEVEEVKEVESPWVQ